MGWGGVGGVGGVGWGGWGGWGGVGHGAAAPKWTLTGESVGLFSKSPVSFRLQHGGACGSVAVF